MVVFGDGAPTGTAPFAELATATRLSSTPRPWLLLTTTQLTAAPGAEFSVSRAETWRSLDFALGLAVPLRQVWNVALLVEAGAQARVFETGAEDAPAARRAGLGLRVASTDATRLAILAVYDERLGGPGALVHASADVAPTLGLVGAALVGRGVTLRLAAVVRWGK